MEDDRTGARRLYGANAKVGGRRKRFAELPDSPTLNAPAEAHLDRIPGLQCGSDPKLNRADEGSQPRRRPLVDETSACAARLAGPVDAADATGSVEREPALDMRRRVRERRPGGAGRQRQC